MLNRCEVWHALEPDSQGRREKSLNESYGNPTLGLLHICSPNSRLRTCLSSFGVIPPYSAQKGLIRKKLRSSPRSSRILFSIFMTKIDNKIHATHWNFLTELTSEQPYAIQYISTFIINMHNKYTYNL